MVAAIRPRGKPAGVWALRRADRPGSAAATALREVAEETGAHGRSLSKLGDIPTGSTGRASGYSSQFVFLINLCDFATRRISRVRGESQTAPSERKEDFRLLRAAWRAKLA
jgi:8-oxo-dGTP pyrophosphatase MutT (NUDIX family)